MYTNNTAEAQGTERDIAITTGTESNTAATRGTESKSQRALDEGGDAPLGGIRRVLAAANEGHRPEEPLSPPCLQFRHKPRRQVVAASPVLPGPVSQGRCLDTVPALMR